MGFPPGVAEELVIKVLRTCDPKNWNGPNSAHKSLDLNNEIMCSTVAQEVEVFAEDDGIQNEVTIIEPDNKPEDITAKLSTEPQCVSPSNVTSTSKAFPEDYKPPEIPIQKNSDTYNGAEREKYLWSQNIMELGNS